MADIFDRLGKHIATSAWTTLYRAYTQEPSDNAILLGCLVSHTSSSGSEARIELRVHNPNGSVASPVERRFITKGCSIEMLPNRFVLETGQSLQIRATPAGLVDAYVSVLNLNLDEALYQSRVQPFPGEFAVTWLPALGAGGQLGILEEAPFAGFTVTWIAPSADEPVVIPGVAQSFSVSWLVPGAPGDPV